MFKSFKSLLLLVPGLEGCSIGPIQARENPSLPLFNASLNVSTGARQQPIRFPPGIFCGWLSRHRNAHQPYLCNPYAIHMHSICNPYAIHMQYQWISMDINGIFQGRDLFGEIFALLLALSLQMLGSQFQIIPALPC
jgi:hypothetical protein